MKVTKTELLRKILGQQTIQETTMRRKETVSKPKINLFGLVGQNYDNDLVLAQMY